MLLRLFLRMTEVNEMNTVPQLHALTRVETNLVVKECFGKISDSEYSIPCRELF